MVRADHHAGEVPATAELGLGAEPLPMAGTAIPSSRSGMTIATRGW